MNPTLRQMRAFVALGRTGSFTLAAESMHVTQAALSGLIKELEQTLGSKVVDRSTRKIALTDSGRELLPLFSKIIEDLDAALLNLADHTNLKKGVVRVAAPQLMSCTLLPNVIAAYRAAHPDIELQLADCAVEEVGNRVLSGEADIGIGPERDPGSALANTLLFEQAFALVFPRGHALEARKRITWADLAKHPFISLQGQFTERLLNDLRGGTHDIALRPAHEVSFMTTAFAMVGAGLGMTVCLPYAAPLVELHELNMRPLTSPNLKRRFFVYRRQNRSLSPAAGGFMNFLLDYVAA